jgi:hypothetical protein
MSQDLNSNMPPLPEDLAGVERALGALKPAPAALNRDHLMYEAGRAAACRSARTHVRIWQGACAVLLVGCAAFALFPLDKTGAKQFAIQPKPQLAQVPPTPPLAVAPSATPATPRSFPSFFFPSFSRIQRPIERTEWPVALRGAENTTAGNPAYTPTLRRSEGLDAFPNWQQRLLIFGGNRS